MEAETPKTGRAGETRADWQHLMAIKKVVKGHTYKAERHREFMWRRQLLPDEISSTDVMRAAISVMAEKRRLDSQLATFSSQKSDAILPAMPASASAGESGHEIGAKK